VADGARGTWHPAALALGCGLSAALFGTWLVEPTRGWWLALDESVFWALNGSLAWSGPWRGFWAVANSRLGDLVEASAVVAVYLIFLFRQDRRARQTLLAVGVMLTGLVVTGIQIGKVLPFQRESGTQLHHGALRLSEMVTWIPTKDISSDTFPGDHATVLLLCAGVISFYLPRGYAIVTWLIAVAFMSPRLVSGAHWLTDDLVGSVAIAGALLSVTFATPLHRVVVDALEGVIGRIRALRGRGSGPA
jgi:membrane-associated phospholipid phosphatase